MNGGESSKVARASLPAQSAGGVVPPSAQCAIFDGYRRRLPHWRLSNATYFVTWRLSPGQAELSSEERSLVVNALRHFDTIRYHLLAFVVMNDHVHVLVQPMNNFALEAITHSWKSFTANQAQRVHGRKGSLWQDESFDRIVRDEDEFFEKLFYILNNPVRRWPALNTYAWVGTHKAFRECLDDDRGQIKADSR